MRWGSKIIVKCVLSITLAMINLFAPLAEALTLGPAELVDPSIFSVCPATSAAGEDKTTGPELVPVFHTIVPLTLWMAPSEVSVATLGGGGPTLPPHSVLTVVPSALIFRIAEFPRSETYMIPEGAIMRLVGDIILD